MTPTGNYREALAYLASRIDYERAPPVRPQREFKLDRMRRLLSLLQDPHEGLRIVHVAGTKGKGSTAAMIAAALTAAGYRTGLYASPHLTAIEQRWAVDGQPATPDDLVRLVAAVERAARRLDELADRDVSLGRPTFFELTTAMAFLQFQHYGCPAVVLEVGLGGRLDATNVCLPEIAVITTISYDHTQILGNTLAQIAREKAGIIKPAVPVVTGVTVPEPRREIEAMARRQGAPLIGLGTEFQYRYRAVEGPDEVGRVDYFSTQPGGLVWENVRLGMYGQHQAANAATAIATLVQLARRDGNISEAAIRQGIASAVCPARIEVVRGSPDVIIDAAHNVASVRALVDVVQERFGGRRGWLVFAASADKDVEGMLRVLVPHFQHLAVTRFVANPRSVPPAQLAQWITQIQQSVGADEPGGRELLAWDDPREAWRDVVRRAARGDFVCIAGSFFLAAELRDLVHADLRGEKAAQAGLSTLASKP